MFAGMNTGWSNRCKNCKLWCVVKSAVKSLLAASLIEFLIMGLSVSKISSLTIGWYTVNATLFWKSIGFLIPFVIAFIPVSSMQNHTWHEYPMCLFELMALTWCLRRGVSFTWLPLSEDLPNETEALVLVLGVTGPCLLGVTVPCLLGPLVPCLACAPGVSSLTWTASSLLGFSPQFLYYFLLHR